MLRDRALVRARCARARRKLVFRAKILRDFLRVRGPARARKKILRDRPSEKNFLDFPGVFATATNCFVQKR